MIALIALKILQCQCHPGIWPSFSKGLIVPERVLQASLIFCMLKQPLPKIVRFVFQRRETRDKRGYRASALSVILSRRVHGALCVCCLEHSNGSAAMSMDYRGVN